MPAAYGIEFQLREACLASGAAWAVVAERETGKWQVRAGYRLSRRRQTSLQRFLDRATVDSWLCGALSGGHARSMSLKEVKGETLRLFVFPARGTSVVLLAAAPAMSTQAQRVWHIVAAGLQPRQKVLNSTAAPAQLLVPALGAELSHDMPRTLDRILSALAPIVQAQGAWLAVRRGEVLDIQAQWNCPGCLKASLPMEGSNLLRRAARARVPFAVQAGQPEWAQVPQAGLKSNTRIWACLPLVIGQRLIGVVALWRQKPFAMEEWRTLSEWSLKIAPVVEVVITFSEMTAHLRRLGVLNDFALTVSSGQNLEQIASRVFALLARAFGTEDIALYLRSAGASMIREYRDRNGKVTAESVTFDSRLFTEVLKTGKIQRYGDVRTVGVGSVKPSTLSLLLVPLKYRGQNVGLLSLESPQPDAFGLHDEHLMVVIASHLAGLVEYGRLREEAEARARSLGLIHEVVQQVIGLTDLQEIAQITADLLAQYFAYELAVVLLTDNGDKLAFRGYGGVSAGIVRDLLAHLDDPVSAGIMGRVFSTGKSMLVNDVTQSDAYQAIDGWDAGSEMCVALRDGGRVLGMIDVGSSSKNAFTQNDLLALESLAGILVGVVSSADQYQRLRETNQRLRTAQVELRASIAAQRSAEDRLVQAAKLAAVGEMAAGVAHELNNPLTTVAGFAELILEEIPADAPHRADLEMILRESRRARDVVRQLLDFARQSESTRARADLNEIVEDVVSLTRHLVRTGGVQLNLELGQDIPWVSVDRNQIKQVLLNLIHNGLQAMPDGGSMQIRTAVQTRAERRWAVLAVSDTGEGIPAAIRDRIFEPFFTTKSDRGGSGLGLSVTYGIVANHGGFIDVQSDPGQGACFTVHLPI